MLMTPAKKKILIAFSSLLLGLGLVLFISNLFSSDYSSEEGSTAVEEVVKESYYEGVITYISQGLYPNDKIGYSLTDASGNEIILLKAKDEMLVVSEGLDVRVYGRVSRTKDGKNKVLLVERVVINNGTD